MPTMVLPHGIGGVARGPTLPALAPSSVIDWLLTGHGGTPMPTKAGFAAWEWLYAAGWMRRASGAWTRWAIPPVGGGCGMAIPILGLATL